MALILVVDDDETQRKTLQKILVREGYDVEIAAGGQEALGKFRERKADVVVTDIRMPEMDGLQLFHEAKRLDHDVAVILITAYGDIQSAVQAMADGASYYLTKPLTPVKVNHLKVLIKKAVENRALLEENKRLREEVSGKYEFGNIVGHSGKMNEVYAALRKVAESDVTVLLLGETGTGKELAARAIHYNSPRKLYPFRKVSCASFPETLLESVLFGHEKGSYTGADARRIGMFESADKGTIFLDEIGEINQNVQVKLLRFLQEKQFERVGGTQTIKVDARVIAATNLDLDKAVQEGKFRKDLYYRLNVVPISMPPLREKKEDIPLLVDHFLEKYEDKAVGRNNESHARMQVSAEVLSVFMDYDWPGNVRELENCIERAIVMGEGDTIRLSDLPVEIRSGASECTVGEIVEEIPPDGISLDQLEKELIIKALKQTKGNQTEAAKMLGISRRTLQYRMDRKYGISAKDYT
jgi:DNA-binding NtrC family response regulator